MDDDKKLAVKRTILPFKPSTIETIDYAVYDWINEELNIFANTNKGFKKVPIEWVAAERSYQIKEQKDLRDKTGALIFPIISLERSGMVKDPTKKGMFYGNIDPLSANPVNGYYKGGSIQIARRIQQNKTATFLNAYSGRKYNQTVGNAQINFPDRNPKDKAVYEEISIPMPVYVDVSYNIKIRTEYQQQMNDLVQPFITRPGTINSFMITRDGHRYETFVQGNYALSNNVSDMTTEERKFETKVDLKVLGYLIGEGDNQDTPKFSVRENAVEVRIPREHVVWDDSISVSGDGMTNRQNTAVDGKYRE